jgi:hypothetical protein
LDPLQPIKGEVKTLTGSWIHRDDLRASWVLLLLGTEDDELRETGSKLSYWEFGVANADKLVETKTQQVGFGSISSEHDLVSKLLTELDQFRYENTVLITPVAATLRALRRRIVATRVETDSLRGFSHICVESLLVEYFDSSLAEYGIDRDSLSAPRVTSTGADTEEVVSTGSVRDFWESWQQLYRLVPADELQGEML